MKFMRKYIHIAKALKPALTKEACDHIAEEYAKLRSQESLDQNNMAKVKLDSTLQVLQVHNCSKTNTQRVSQHLFPGRKETWMNCCPET